MISENVMEVLDEYNIDERIFTAYCEAYNIDINNTDENDVQKCEEAYKGEFVCDEDFCRYLIRDTGWCDDNVLPYLDWDSVCRDFMMDYTECNCCYFRNY